MPYALQQEANGYYVVNKDTGKTYSHHPISKQKAEAQLRVLNATLEGGINLAEATDYWVKEGYPTDTARWLRQNASEQITSLTVRRAPVSKGLETAFQLLTLGKWEEAKKNIGYDSMYHLALIVNGKYLVEKLSRVHLSSTIDHPRDAEFMEVPLTKRLFIGDMLERTEAQMGQSNYFRYDPFNNNCQFFVFSILSANGLMTPELNAFIVQPVDELLQEQPDWLAAVSKTLTNLGAITGLGRSKGKFEEQLKESGLSPSAYLLTAQRAAKKAGYPYKLLGFADDGVHKLAIPNPDGRIVRFGRVGYGDYILWSNEDAEYAEQKKRTFHASHEAIKGNWKKDPFSPNSLALAILW